MTTTGFYKPPRRMASTALVMVLLLLAALLYLHGFPGLLPYYLDPDEPHFYLAATELRLTGQIRINNLYPPLRPYQMAAEQWLLDYVSGGSASTKVYGVFARAGSAFAGLVMLALIYRISRRLHSGAAGLFAVSLIAFDLQLVYFSHVARGDTWSWALTAGVIWAATELVRSDRKSLWVAIALCSLGAFLSKYSAAPIWLLPAYLLLRRFFPALSTQLAILALGLTLAAGGILYLRAHALIWQEPLERMGFIFLLANEFRFDKTFGQSFVNFYTGLGKGWFFSGLIGFPALLLWKKELPHQSTLTVVGLLAAVCLGTAAVFTLTVARYHDAYTVVIIWALVGGLGLAQFARHLGKFGPIIGFAFAVTLNGPRILTAWQYGEDYTTPHSLASLGGWFIANVPQGARVVVEQSTPFNSYAGFPGRPIYHQYTVDSLFDENSEAYRERGYEYLVWSSKGYHSPEQSDPQTLASQAYFTNAVEVARWLPPEYRPPAIVVFQLPPLQQYPLYAWFTPAISFRGYDLNKDTFAPGEQIELMLYWMSAERVPNNYIVFVHLINAGTGQLAAGQDGPPDYGNTPTYQWRGDMDFIRDQRRLTVPADIAPGAYTLRIGMYDADTQARVEVLDLNYQPTGDGLALQTVHITR